VPAKVDWLKFSEIKNSPLPPALRHNSAMKHRTKSASPCDLERQHFRDRLHRQAKSQRSGDPACSLNGLRPKRNDHGRRVPIFLVPLRDHAPLCVNQNGNVNFVPAIPTYSRLFPFENTRIFRLTSIPRGCSKDISIFSSRSLKNSAPSAAISRRSLNRFPTSLPPSSYWERGQPCPPPPLAISLVAPKQIGCPIHF